MVLTSLFIFILSLLTIFSLSPIWLISQLVALAIGLIAALIFSRLGYLVHQRLAWHYYFFSLILLLTTFLFGRFSRGSTRWLILAGFSLQASEIVKPLLIISFSYFSQRWPAKNWRNFSLLFGLFLPVWLLVFQQPDLGSSLVLGLIWLAIIFASGLSGRIIATLVLISGLSLPLFRWVLKDYQLGRLQAFIRPEADPLGSGYHTLQALITVGSGAIFGRGLGQGGQVQLRFLPERQTDFILASFAEEFGFLGSVILLGLYFYLLLSLLKLTEKTRDKFSFLLAVGCFSALFVQTSLNLAINLGLLPVTGITLPLFSAGGSSLVATLAILGLAWGLVRRQNQPSSLEIK